MAEVKIFNRKKEVYGFVLRRLLVSLILIFSLITFLFFLIQISPGDPLEKFVDPKLSSDAIDNLRSKFGLDKPVLEQYLLYMKNFVKGDLGISYEHRIPVITVILNHLPFTLFLGTFSFGLAIFLGYKTAIHIYNKNDAKTTERFSNSLLFMYSIPNYVLAVILIYIFSLQLKILPSSNYTSIFIESENLFVILFDRAKHLVLPIIVFTNVSFIQFYRYISDNLQSVSSKDYINYLRSNGFPEKEILKRHIIPNSLTPLISIAGMEFALILGGSILIETIFSLPGMGRLAVDSILGRDYPLIIGTTFVSACLVIWGSFLSDLIKVRIDKRLVLLLK